MARVRDRLLYKANAPFVKPMSKRDFEKALTAVKQSLAGVAFFEQEDIGQAFVWMDTPQKGQLWHALYTVVGYNKDKQNEQD